MARDDLEPQALEKVTRIEVGERDIYMRTSPHSTVDSLSIAHVKLA